jgi:hypothetical protein
MTRRLLHCRYRVGSDNWLGDEVTDSTRASIFRTVSLSSMQAMIFTAPPQCSQTLTSIKKYPFQSPSPPG